MVRLVHCLQPPPPSSFPISLSHSIGSLVAPAEAAAAGAAAVAARAATEAAAACHYLPGVIAAAGPGVRVVTGCGTLPAHPPRLLVSISQQPASASIGLEIHTHLLA